MSMRIKAALIIMLVLVVVTIASLITNFLFIRTNITNAVDQDLSLAINIADSLVSTKLQLIKANGKTIAERLVNAGSNDGMSEIMAAEISEHPEFRALTVFDRTHGIVANYGVPVKSAELLEESRYVQMAYNGESVIPTTHYDPQTNDFVMHVFIPMSSEMVMAGTIDGMTFSDFIRNYRLWQTGSIFILDDEGTLIANNSDEMVLGRHNAVKEALLFPLDREIVSRKIIQDQMYDTEEGDGTFLFDNKDYTCRYKRVTGSTGGWYVMVAAPIKEGPEYKLRFDLLISSLVFLFIGFFVSIFASPFLIKNFEKIEEQAAQIIEAHKRTNLLLNAMPLACHLWNSNYEMFYCNDENQRLFRLDNADEFINNYRNFVPEYQSDGEPSLEKRNYYLKKAFEKGRYKFEWLYLLQDGTAIPTEIVLVRMPFDDENVVAAYTRDLREQKKMMGDIIQRDMLLDTVNSAAAILLKSEIDEFERNLKLCMSMIAEAMDLDRIYIWKNHVKDGKTHAAQLYKWSNGVTPQHNDTCTFVLPVFLRDEFWGNIGFDDCHREREFTENEQSILSSAGNVITYAVFQNEMAKNIRAGAAKLEAALIEARGANNAKSYFLARMSHEMRTPLNAIIGLSELSLETEGASEEIYENLEKVYGAGVVLLSTVNDILDISKIEAGKLELVPAVYSTPSLINDTITQNILRIGEKPIKFILNIDPFMPAHLYGDELRTKQIFNNLLSNAFKYTKRGKVELNVQCERDKNSPPDGGAVWITVRVRDTGKGIKPEDLDNLFNDYTQVDKNANRTIEGTGLGLSITRKIAEMMDGYVSAECDYGRGCIFTARLKQQYVDDAIIGEEVVQNLKNFRYFDNRRKNKFQLLRNRMPYARVLVVDDMPTNLDVAKGMLKPYGIQIDCISSGREAVNIIRDEKVKYDAVFMDHMMPEMDGITATRIIREKIGTEYARTVPIIALTANAIVGNEKMFLDKGFQAFISKPIDVTQLDSILNTWIRDRQSDETLLLAEKELIDNEAVHINRVIAARIFKEYKIEGVDFTEGIERYYDEEAYLNLIRSYHLHTPALLDKLRTFGMQEKNNPLPDGLAGISLSEYTIIVHGLKGSSYSISANSIGREAEKLEKAARAGEMETIIKGNAPFITMTEALLSELGRLLNKISEMREKPVKKAPDPESIAQLFTAAKEYKASVMEQLIKDLESFSYESDNDFIVWLREQMDNLDYEAIIERLQRRLEN